MPSYRALTVMQPYATLIMIGAKPFETRGQRADQSAIGQRVAIHAGLSTDMLDMIYRGKLRGSPTHLAIQAALPGTPARQLTELPLGKVLGTARLAGAYQVARYNEATLRVTIGANQNGSAPMPPVTAVDRFGDYRPGRWLYWLVDVEPFATPVPARGHQGWWDWQSQESLL